jgi:diguanylate cyclase (GGDEF)-like protein/PAS domain S-box-containing protein
MRLLSTIRALLSGRRSASAGDGMSDAMFREIAEHSGDIIMRVGADGRINYVSPASARILGWQPEEMIGHGAAAFICEEDVALVQVKIDMSKRDLSDSSTTQMRMKRKDGSLVWVEGQNRTIRDPGTRALLNTIVVIRDMAAHKALEERLAAMALTDGLTGIANRRAFDQVLEREWKRTLRAGSTLSLLLLDIDHFKRFNDRLGHQVGDDCLRAVAACVSGLARREGDLVARYGGEELAMILPDTEMAGAERMAEAARAAVEAQRIPHPDADGPVTVSIGAATAMAQVGGSITMPEGLLQAADAALYKAKERGRNRVESTLLITSDAAARAA